MYTVRAGDTLADIAARHRQTVDSLLHLNPAITNPNRLQVGQKLNVGEPLPLAVAPPPPVPPLWEDWIIPHPPRLNSSHWDDAAREYKIDRPALEAVAEVESGADAFLADGRPKILFEAHVFGRLTNGIYNRTHTNISQPKWNKGVYIGGAGEYRRLQAAMALNPEAALQSASWGRFQLMGFNHAACGYSAVAGFVRAMFSGEQAQLKAFLAFLVAVQATRLLREHRWEELARVYNGPAAEANHYGEKLAKAYRRASAKNGGSAHV